jgi:hypothetical protein
MLFYCPNCRQEKNVEPVSTITTLSGRVAYKANCPVCNQDMAEFNPEKVTTEDNPASKINS